MRGTRALAVTAAALLAWPAPASAAADLPVSLPYNHDCIAPGLVVVGDGDCDGQFQSYVAESLPKAGPTTAAGIRFTFPSSAAGAKNSMVATRQTVKLPGKTGYSYLHALVAGTNAPGGAAGGAVTVTYKGGSRGTGSITGFDWYQQADRSAIKAKGQGLLNPGSQSPLGPANVYLFVVSVKLDPRRAALSVTMPPGTLPSTSSSPKALHVFALTLASHPATAPRRGPVFN